MLKGKLAAKNRIVLSMILPVFLVGLAITVVSVYFWTKPVISFIENRTEAELELASDLALQACSERLNYLLNLRLENNPEMVESTRAGAIEEVLRISGKLDHIHLLIVENNKTVIAASLPGLKWSPPTLARHKSTILSDAIGSQPIRMHYRYFPFWRWHVVSFIYEKDYMGPISLAKRTVYVVSLSVLLLVTATVFLLFDRMVSRPMKKIIKAAEGVAQGRYTKLRLRRQDEMGQVAQAFDSMVESLEEDKNWIHAIMSKLKESEERYRLLTENSLANIMMVQDGRFTYANRTTIATTGYSADELYKMEVLDLVHPDDRNLVKEVILGRVEDDWTACRYEFRYLTKQGETRWLELLAVPTLYKGKTATLGHAIDITDRKVAMREQRELEEKLHHAQKFEALGTIVGSVAHDLNNILSGLVGYPDLLLLQIPEGNPMRRYILNIQLSGQKAAAIVQDLLTMVRRGVVVQEVVNLNSIISDCLGSPEFEKLKSFHPDVEVKISLDSGLLNISGSRIHLLKTVMNLISNAAQACLQGGITRVETENRRIDAASEGPKPGHEALPQGEYVVLRVSDDGVGIAPEDQARIFEPFYTKKVMGRSGTGLGMAVVWSTVQDHRGYISVQSEEGKGTTFELHFPASRENTLIKQNRLSMGSYRGSETILVVDDVKEQRELARDILSRLGYAVAVAASGEEAIEYFQRNGSADLLVLDMIMDPGIDGLETYRRILAMKPGLKAIIASGFSETERVRETQRLGARTCIVKPFTIEKLAAAVREELDRSGEHPTGTA